MLLFVFLLFGLELGGCFNASEAPLRIIGGHEVRIEDFYWQISMSYKGIHACGGSILSEDRILTAAHCVFRINYPENYKHILIRAGSRHHNKGGVIVKISKIVQHADFNKPTFLNNDIAVVILQEKFKFSSALGSIPIPLQNEILRPSSLVSVTGWGQTNAKISQSLRVAGTENLLGVDVPVVDFERCSKAYKKYPGKARLTDYMFCAGFLGTGGKDACQGDSGGPLVLGKGNRAILYGIVSWGHKCAHPDFPGIYTRISSYINWIKGIK